MPFTNLHSALMALPHTGPRGFEGLVRDALAEISGQGFRLMKSGPQGGVDSIGERSGSGLVIGMEGKHYGASTALPLDALKSKLRDAASSFPVMDLWLLATTRSIDGGDATALEREGDALGVATLILDWSEFSAVPPGLAILCAAAPNATDHHLGHSGALVADLNSIRTNSYFAREAARLRDRLRDATIGLAAARSALRDWARNQMRDDASARTAFDSYATLEAPGTIKIDRPKIIKALDDWWSDASAPPAVLLGQEGMGKTWTALGWWLARSEADADFPLTIVVPARDVTDIDGPYLVAQMLFRATRLRDIGYWQRRLERWSSIEEPAPLILLVIDGLNQNWMFDRWSDLMISLATPQWRNKVRTLLTCRPDHWTHGLKGLADLRSPVSSIPIERFEDEELDTLLARHGLARADFPKPLPQFLRVPRFSNLAITRRRELQDSGDITPARLVYEDWRHRHPGAQRVLSHDEFRRFIARLGQHASDGLNASTLSRRELIDRLSGDDGRSHNIFEGILSELIDGGWLAVDQGTQRFKLAEARIADALGLALLEELRTATTLADIGERLARLIDPLRGQDLSVAILRSATTFALLDPGITRLVRQTLLERWIRSQNFGPADFESYWRLIGCAPELFLDMAEAEWFGETGSTRAGEVLVKGFSNAWRWPNVASGVIERLTGWFSRYWLDPLEGEILGQVDQDEHARARRDATRERALNAREEGIAAHCGLDLVEVAPVRQAWGAYRATELLSWLPRAPMVPVFTAWALTYAIMGGRRQQQRLAWVLRWNDTDPAEAEAVLLARADALIERGSAIARSAAQALLSALATPAAMLRHDSVFGADPETPARRPAWPDGPAPSQRPDAPLAEVANLHPVAPSDPAIDILNEWIARLEKLSTKINDTQLLAERERDDGGLHIARSVLARWAPATLALLLRRRFRAAAAKTRIPLSSNLPRWVLRALHVLHLRQEEGPHIPGVIRGLPAALLALTDEDLDQWRRLGDLAVDRGVPVIFNGLVPSLLHQPAGRQIIILASIAADIEIPSWFHRYLAPLQSSDFDELAARLSPDQPHEERLRWLRYLNMAPVGAMPERWGPLASLLTEDAADIRTNAMEIVWRNERTGLADILFESGWRCASDLAREEQVMGSLALTFAGPAATGDVIDRVHPQILGILTDRFPDQPAYLERFADHVLSEIEYVQTAKSLAYPRALIHGEAGWRRLVDRHGRALRHWMAPFLDGTSNSLMHHLYGFAGRDFPTDQAIDMIDLVEPGTKARIITAALEAATSSNFRSGDLYAAGVTLSGSVGEKARELVLSEANDDRKLFDFAMGLQDHGQTDWLIERIIRDIESGMTGWIARGFTLAGFLIVGPQAETLWTHRLMSIPVSGWLGTVRSAARDRYQRWVDSRHWFYLYRDTPDDPVAFGAYELLVASVDQRLMIVDHRPTFEELTSWPWRRSLHWSVNWERMKEAAKADYDRLAKTFLAGDLPLMNQYPRRT